MMLHALAHLVDAALPAGEAVALVAGDDVEVQPVVDLVGLVAADIPVDARGAQVRAAEAEVDAVLGRDHADAARALQEHPVLVEQPLVVADPVREDRAELPDPGDVLVGQVLAHAADPAERGVHARAGDHLHEVHDHLALAHGVEQRGHRAEVHRQRAGDQQVAGEPRQLGHQHADVLRPLRRLDVEELLDRQREGEVVGGRAEIVEPVGQREDLRVGEALGQLLGAPVEIADVGIDARDVSRPPSRARAAGRRGCSGAAGRG